MPVKYCDHHYLGCGYNKAGSGNSKVIENHEKECAFGRVGPLCQTPTCRTDWYRILAVGLTGYCATCGAYRQRIADSEQLSEELDQLVAN